MVSCYSLSLESKVSDWRNRRICAEIGFGPVPANWSFRVGIGIRRPTYLREGTLRGAFAASGLK